MRFLKNKTEGAHSLAIYSFVSKLVRLKRVLRPKTRIALILKCYPCLGLRQAAAVALWRQKCSLHIRPKGVLHALQIRPHSTDLIVFFQIFVEKEYSPLAKDRSGLVIDAGANVGYSSIYFLNKWPDCSVIAIEPDPDNYQALAKNLAPYNKRARPINCAVWSMPVSLYLRAQRFRGGGAWAGQYVEVADGSSVSVRSTTVGELLENSGYSRISLLKMDIEGGESAVFGSPDCQQWLQQTDSIAVELHEDAGFGDASEIFFNSISGHGFVVSRSGELIICQR